MGWADVAPEWTSRAPGRGNRAWLNAAFTVAASLLFVLALPGEAHSCRNPRYIRWNIFSEVPVGDYQVVAEVRITALNRPFRFNTWRGAGTGREVAYEADAEV